MTRYYQTNYTFHAKVKSVVCGVMDIIDNCEKELPRNQTCVVIGVAKEIKQNDEKTR